MRPIAALVVALVLVACAGATPSESELTRCERNVRDAAAFPDDADAILDTDPAIQLCESIAELEAASELYPDAFDGVPVRDFLRNRCTSPEVSATAVCQELGG